jgi:hypothetical protein
MSDHSEPLLRRLDNVIRVIGVILTDVPIGLALYIVLGWTDQFFGFMGLLALSAVMKFLIFRF